MENSLSTTYSILFSVLGLSSLFWILLLFNPSDIIHIKHCHVPYLGLSHSSLKMFLEMNPFSDLMIGWTIMVIAMMLPKLIMPIEYIYARSFKQKRFFVASSFVLGYIAIWVITGFVMNSVIIGFNLLMPMSYIPAILVSIVAIIWQFAPIKQRFLNLGHNHKTFSVFGAKAFSDALLFGIEHGLWCIGSGWALMLFPMLLLNGHNLAMFIVTFIMISEHMEHPKTPAWYFSFRLKLLEILIVQTQIGIESLKKTATDKGLS